MYAGIQQYLYFTDKENHEDFEKITDTLLLLLNKVNENRAAAAAAATQMSDSELVYNSFKEFLGPEFTYIDNAWIQTDYYSLPEECDDSLSIALTVCMCNNVYVTCDNEQIRQHFLSSFPIPSNYEKIDVNGECVLIKKK